jgi:transcriptional regulator with XRE-family HTH domain
MKVQSPRRTGRPTTIFPAAVRRTVAPKPSVMVGKTTPRPVHNRGQDPISRALNLYVARQIKLLRVTNGKTQTQLGEILGMTFQQIAKYERGFSRVSPDKLWAMAEYFGIEIGYFFDGFDKTAIDFDNPPVAIPLSDDRLGDKRLRLELAGAIQQVRSTRMLRSLISFVRAATE